MGLIVKYHAQYPKHEQEHIREELTNKKCKHRVFFLTIAFGINNDLETHRQIKTNDIISRRFSNLMTPLSRVQRRIKLTNASSRVITSLHSGGGYKNTLAQIESVCMFKLGVNCLM